MNFPPETFGEAMLVLAALLLLGIAAHLLARWLRSRGHGPQLEAIGAKLDRLQSPLQWLARSVFLGSLGAARALHTLPVLGSRHSRQAIDEIAAQVRAESQNRPQRPM